MPYQSPFSRYVWEYKNLDWIDTSIVINDWETPLAKTYNVRAWELVVEQTNNGATAEDIEVEVIINDVTKTVSQSMNSGTRYYVYGNFADAWQAGTGAISMRGIDPDQVIPLETRSLSLRIRQTSAVDVTSAQFEVNLVYDQLYKGS